MSGRRSDSEKAGAVNHRRFKVEHFILFAPVVSTVCGFSFLESYINNVGVRYVTASLADVGYYSIVILTFLGLIALALAPVIGLAKNMESPYGRYLYVQIAFSVVPLFAATYQRQFTKEILFTLCYFAISIEILTLLRFHPANPLRMVGLDVRSPLDWLVSHAGKLILKRTGHEPRRVSKAEEMRRAESKRVGVFAVFSVVQIYLLLFFIPAHVGKLYAKSSLTYGKNQVTLMAPAAPGCLAPQRLLYVGTNVLILRCGGNPPAVIVIHGQENVLMRGGEVP